MQASALALLMALLGVASAAPKAAPRNFDDVLLIGGDGSHQWVKDSELQRLMSRGLLQPAPAPAPAPALPVPAPAPAVRARCEQSEEVQVTSDERFLNWDIPMSRVVSAAGGEASVGISSGYSIQNSVTVTAGMTATIEAVLGLSFSVAYSESWTSSETNSVSYTLTAGQFGIMVSQPMVRRITGNYLGGCTDAPDRVPFVSDTYTSQTYDNFEWVEGVVRLCNSSTYPIPYCIGEGAHY